MDYSVLLAIEEVPVDFDITLSEDPENPQGGEVQSSELDYNIPDRNKFLSR